jgi:hypothetical protein
MLNDEVDQFGRQICEFDSCSSWTGSSLARNRGKRERHAEEFGHLSDDDEEVAKVEQRCREMSPLALTPSDQYFRTWSRLG